MIHDASKETSEVSRQRNKLVRDVYYLALKRTGWTHRRMGLYLRGNWNMNIGFVTFMALKSGEKLRLARFIRLASLAGIPRAFAFTLWVREGIPESSGMKKYIGCTVRFPALKHYVARKGREAASPYNTEQSYHDMIDYIKNTQGIKPSCQSYENVELSDGQFLSGRSGKAIRVVGR